jgi:phosphohistidine swiveling domain-containing protein
MKNKEKKEEYELIFQMPSEVTQPFIIDMVINGGYDEFLYIFEKNNPNAEMYLSNDSQKILAETGLTLFSSEKNIQSLLQKEKKLSKTIDGFLQTIPLEKVKNNDSVWLKNNLINYYEYFSDYCKIYRFTEVIYSPLVDKTIKDFVTKHIEDKNLINHALSVLLNPSEKEKIVKERGKILSQLKANKNIIYLCESVRTIGKEKLSMRNNINNYWGFFENFLDEIAKRLFLSPAQAKSLFCNELVEILENNGNVSDDILDKANRRNIFFVAKKENAKYYFYTDQNAQKITKTVRKEIKKNITEIRGDVASIGYAKGRVIILPIGIGKEGKEKLKQKMTTMKKGDILVAATTGPEMIMACRKATAIVAEEGGINSHAAIISRELEIPGIVNTKIATKVLHDGDIIEVDANKGIVKILKKYGK